MGTDIADLFVLNVGNTNTQYALYSGGRFRHVKYCPTLKLRSRIIPEDIPVAASTVVPSVKKIFKGKKIFWLGPSVKTRLDFSLVDNLTLGADRVANAVALAEFAKLPAIVIDCGTAITVDVVGKKGIFLGGAILPGRMMLRKSLNNFTAQLPLIPLSFKKPAAIGKNTKNAILSGVDLGILGAVREIIRNINLKMCAESCRILAVGGDAGFFIRGISGLKYGGKDFTLHGIAEIWKFNRPQLANTKFRLTVGFGIKK